MSIALIAIMLRSFKFQQENDNVNEQNRQVKKNARQVKKNR